MMFSESTKVTFHRGATRGTSRIVAVIPKDSGSSTILTAETPFHPVDRWWPDQPGDMGFLRAGSLTIPVIDCVLVGLDPATSEVFVGPAIPDRKNCSGWTIAVGHQVAGVPPEVLLSLCGEAVELEVDNTRRAQLSAAHTACHLMALALNSCTASLWAKESERRDSLGAPDLDQLAIEESRISVEGSQDHYRFGKSLRKAGFDGNSLLSSLGDIEARVNGQLAAWTRTSSPVQIEPENATITERRFWSCKLPDGEARIPCGGTHVADLIELRAVRARFEPVPGAPELIVHTVVER